MRMRGSDTKQELLSMVLGFVAALEGNEDCDDEDCKNEDCAEERSSLLDDALDVEYMIDAKGNYLGAQVLMTFGGPYIYINTRYSKVEGYWGSDVIERSYTDAIGFGDTWEEMFNGLRGE